MATGANAAAGGSSGLSTRDISDLLGEDDTNLLNGCLDEFVEGDPSFDVGLDQFDLSLGLDFGFGGLGSGHLGSSGLLPPHNVPVSPTKTNPGFSPNIPSHNTTVQQGLGGRVPQSLGSLQASPNYQGGIMSHSYGNMYFPDEGLLSAAELEVEPSSQSGLLYSDQGLQRILPQPSLAMSQQAHPRRTNVAAAQQRAAANQLLARRARSAGPAFLSQPPIEDEYCANVMDDDLDFMDAPWPSGRVEHNFTTGQVGLRHQQHLAAAQQHMKAAQQLQRSAVFPSVFAARQGIPRTSRMSHGGGVGIPGSSMHSSQAAVLNRARFNQLTRRPSAPGTIPASSARKHAGNFDYHRVPNHLLHGNLDRMSAETIGVAEDALLAGETETAAGNPLIVGPQDDVSSIMADQVEDGETPAPAVGASRSSGAGGPSTPIMANKQHETVSDAFRTPVTKLFEETKATAEISGLSGKRKTGSALTSSKASAGTDGGQGGDEDEEDMDEEHGDSAPNNGMSRQNEQPAKRKKKSQNEKIEELKVQVYDLREQNQALKKKAGKLASDKSKILTCLTNLSMLVGQKKVENEMLKSKIAQLQEVVCEDAVGFPGQGGQQQPGSLGGPHGRDDYPPTDSFLLPNDGHQRPVADMNSPYAAQRKKHSVITSQS